MMMEVDNKPLKLGSDSTTHKWKHWFLVNGRNIQI